MSNVKFELNLPGLNALMKSPEMQSALNAAAKQIAQNSGDGTDFETAHPIGFIAIASTRGSNDNGKMEKGMGGVRV